MARPRIDFRPLTRRDLPAVSRWLAQPHVARWWRDPSDLPGVEAAYLPCIDGRDPTEVFVLLAARRRIGLIQRYLVDDNPEWAHALRATGAADWAVAAGIDYLIGDVAMTGRGIGSAAISGFSGQTFARYPQADCIAVTVAQANVASWRALERAGYTRRWAGELESSDPSDEGPEYLYLMRRPGG